MGTNIHFGFHIGPNLFCLAKVDEKKIICEDSTLIKEHVMMCVIFF